jgi:hypothetical protein
MPKIFSDTQPHLVHHDGASTNLTNSMARLEPVSSAFYDAEDEVDPQGNELQWRDDNFTYPGRGLCVEGCPQAKVDVGEVQYRGAASVIPRWWCSRGCQA